MAMDLMAWAPAAPVGFVEVDSPKPSPRWAMAGDLRRPSSPNVSTDASRRSGANAFHCTVAGARKNVFLVAINQGRE